MGRCGGNLLYQCEPAGTNCVHVLIASSQSGKGAVLHQQGGVGTMGSTRKGQEEDGLQAKISKHKTLYT